MTWLPRRAAFALVLGFGLLLAGNASAQSKVAAQAQQEAQAIARDAGERVDEAQQDVSVWMRRDLPRSLLQQGPQSLLIWQWIALLPLALVATSPGSLCARAPPWSARAHHPAHAAAVG